ncbi:hypothetical protein V6N12_058767 [Hibiscus sabdariffa]|uniref:Uncharacterized protein n=1 Tax=Hibiscus sabdariffa TaxID=183260 RepID=A0ABR2ET74_9ROSI
MEMVFYAPFHCNLLVVAILDPLGFLALQSIRKSLHDLASSNFFVSWDFTFDPYNFIGVYCDFDKVIAINLGDSRLSSPGLTGRIGVVIGKRVYRVIWRGRHRNQRRKCFEI